MLDEDSFILTASGYPRPSDLLPEDLLLDRSGDKIKYSLKEMKHESTVIMNFSN
jgi:hypothetical protein